MTEPLNLNQVTLPVVVDFDGSVAFYRAMGFELIVHSPPRYARFGCPEGDATFSLHVAENASTGNGVVVYFECADLDAQVERVRAAGIAFSQPPVEQPWRWREARLLDPSGNELCLFSAGEFRRNPPWRVKPGADPSPSS